MQDVEQVASGSGEPIEPGDHQHITGLKSPEHLGKLGAVCPRTALFLAVDLGAASRVQLRIL
jgi:hypothetical protein